MEIEMLLLKPIHKEIIWGGQKLNNIFNENSLENIGESWVVSALDEDDNIIMNSEYSGQTLSQVYSSHPELFGHFKSSEFPILVKFIDAKQDLSIQVHPDDEYAKLNENSNGKTECWLVLEADDDAEIIIGHRFADKMMLKKAIDESSLLPNLNRFKIKNGDLFYIPAGTIHAICRGALIYEIQQSSKITYRIFDYNRTDANEKHRELHIQKALDVIEIPDRFYQNTEIHNIDKDISGLIESSYFKVRSLWIDSPQIYCTQGSFNILGCVQGAGSVNGIKFKAGDHAILPNGLHDLHLEGHMKLVLITPKNMDFS